MTEQVANFGHTTLAEALDDTELGVDVTDGSVFPSSGDFRVQVEAELMLVTSRATNTLTVTRGIEGTTAASHSSGLPIDARLTAAGLLQVLRENGPGTELAYVEQTSTTNITNTSEATGHQVVSAGALTFDGSTRVCIEFYCAEVYSDVAGGIIFDLSDGGTEVGRMGVVFGHTGDHRSPVLLRRFLTPSAASHTYAIQAWRTAGSPSVDAGAGGSGTVMPAYIRITIA